MKENNAVTNSQLRKHGSDRVPPGESIDPAAANIIGLARPYRRLKMRCSQRVRTWSTKRSYIVAPLSVCSLELTIYGSK